MQTAIKAAQRKIDAIDKRIDAVRAELHRVAGIDPDHFDYDTQDGFLAACIAAGNTRRDCPGFDGIERALFIRRSYAVDARNDLLDKEARAAARRAVREYQRQFEASRHPCPDCGHEHYAAA